MEKEVPGHFVERVTCWILYSAKEIIMDSRASPLVSEEQFRKMPEPSAGDFEAEFHCVLRNKSGKLVDPTPDMNPKRVVRRIVVEPRMTADLLDKYGLTTPENIASDNWARLTPVSGNNPDFFKQLKQLEFYKTLNYIAF